MSAGTISLLNFAIHSLVLAAAGWVITRFCIRDAMRRSIAANLALIVTLCGAFDVSFWQYPRETKPVPVVTTVRHAFSADWRIVVPAQTTEPQPMVVTPPQRSAWDVNVIASWLRWTFWSVAAALLTWHLAQSVRVQRWAWRLRFPSRAEYDALPHDVRCERLRVFDGAGTPCVAGLFKPVIAVPASAFQTLTAREWRWLMRHEEEHLRCNDTVAAFLHGIIRALAWWNPFVHALIESFARAREEVCDAAAVRGEGDSGAYAEFLLGWANQPRLQTSGVMPIAQSRPARRLRSRLVALMEARGVRQRLGALFVLACAALALLGPVLVSSIGIATSAVAQGPAAVKAEGGQMFTRIYKVPPDFAKDAKDAKSWLVERGVSFPDGAASVLSRAASQLIVKNTKANLEKVEKLVAAGSVIAPQVYVTSKIIVADKFFGEHGKVLSKPKVQEILRSAAEAVVVANRVSGSDGIAVTKLPSITTKMAQRATVEMIREGPPSDPPKFAGTIIEIGTLPKKNGRIEASINPAFGTDDGKRLLDTRDISKVDWSHVIILATEARAEIVSGDTLVAHLKVGIQHITTLVTMMALAPNGEPAPGGFGEKISLVSADELEKNKTDLQSPRDFEIIAKQVEERNAAAERRRIYLTAKVVDATQPKDSGLGFDWLLDSAFGIPSVASSGNAVPAEKPKAQALPPPGIIALAGVMTDPQFQVVIRALLQRKDATMASLPSATVKPEVAHTFVIPKELESLGLIVKPVISADGYTLDLNISASSAPGGDAPRKVNTAVTIWDGHTVVLGGLMSEDEKGKHSRLIFITAKIIDSSGAPLSKQTR
ncbi:MAG: hypothetical protein K1X78_11350 [Verrucomicrobiaceae bacterium]|nr:hypothetical protein [Verrucomicrobiaceae bacterium]